MTIRLDHTIVPTRNGIDYWADPERHEDATINHHDGGRGVYFPNPDGHLLEIITVPYGRRENDHPTGATRTSTLRHPLVMMEA